VNHSNPIAVVTGANRGLGKEVSRQLAAQGYTVIVTSRSIQKAQSAVEELKEKNLIAAQLDVANPQSIKELSEQLSQQFGRIDVLVNNAAIHYDTWQNAYNADMNTVQEAMQTNVYGAWRMVQAFLPLLRKSAHPRIVNVSSGGGALNGMSGGTPAYSVTKASLNALTLMLADELKREKFLVNAVCPGWVATDMGGFGGRPVKDGASGIVWAATLPVYGPTGGFFRDGKRIDW